MLIGVAELSMAIPCGATDRVGLCGTVAHAELSAVTEKLFWRHDNWVSLEWMWLDCVVEKLVGLASR
jgi:hypothetical protein